MNIFTLRSTASIVSSCLAAAWLPIAATAATLDPATLVAKADVETLLGRPVVTTPAGAETEDEDTGGMVRYCTFHGGPMAVVVSVVTFSSPQAALAKTNSELVAGRLDGDGVKVIEEKSLGDRAFWGSNYIGAEYVVVKGAHVLGIAIGGKLAQAPASYRQALRSLAVTAVAKL